MKKTMFFRAAMAAFLSFAVLACRPDNPEGNNNQNGNGGQDGPPAQERTISIYNGATELDALEFTADATKYDITVTANFEWELDKDATTWPVWIKKPATTLAGEFNDDTDLYEATFTLEFDLANVASYYDNKTGELTFLDVEDLDYAYDFPVSHTFEKPAEPASILSNALGTNILTVTTDGKIRGTDSNTLEITIDAAEGQADFRGFLAARTSFDQNVFNEIQTMYEWKAAADGNYTPGVWATIAHKEGNVYTLTINDYPSEYTPGTANYSIKTVKGFLFVLPSDVYNTWEAPFPGVDDPTKNVWYMAAAGNMMDKYAENGVYDEYQKYVITLNVEQPAE